MAIQRNSAAALAACIVLAAAAQGRCLASEVVYKSTGPHGDVTYGFTPAPGAVRSEKLEIETFSPVQRRALLRLPDVEPQRRREWDRVELELKAAHSALRRAENALDVGRNSRAGERLGNKGGGARLTQAYFERIRRLEQSVEAAKQRLDAAYEARNQLK